MFTIPSRSENYHYRWGNSFSAKLSLEDPAEVQALPKRDQDIIGRDFGVYGYPKSDLRDIAIRNRMKEGGVETAKTRARKILWEECLGRFAWKLRRAARMVDQA